MSGSTRNDLQTTGAPEGRPRAQPSSQDDEWRHPDPPRRRLTRERYTYKDVNGAMGIFRTTVNTAHAARNSVNVLALIRGIGSDRPLTCLTVHAR